MPLQSVSNSDIDPTTSQVDPQTPYALSVREACKRLGNISRSNFYRRVERGDIAVRKLGSRTVVMAAEIERFLNSLPIKALR